jgi:ABC-type nitrate/sulfonate/bicarbonate transport system ATPase subunit
MLAFFIETLVIFEAVILAVIAGLFARNSMKQKAMTKKVEERAALRQQESLLAIRLMSANVNLGIATAVSVKNNEVNGFMDTALKEAEKASEAYQTFLKEIAAKQMSAAKI